MKKSLFMNLTFSKSRKDFFNPSSRGFSSGKGQIFCKIVFRMKVLTIFCCCGLLSLFVLFIEELCYEVESCLTGNNVTTIISIMKFAFDTSNFSMGFPKM